MCLAAQQKGRQNNSQMMLKPWGVCSPRVAQADIWRRADRINGAVSGGALEAGGYVHGIIPYFLNRLKLETTRSKAGCVENMHERKAKMYVEADGFIVLPGGLGTMDEWMEVMTWNQLGLLKAPVFVMNTDGYWQAILNMIDHANKTGFIHSKGVFEMHVASTPDELIDLIDDKKQVDG